MCRATPQGASANLFTGNTLLESSAAEVARLVAGNIERAAAAFARARGSANHRLHTDPSYIDELLDERAAVMEIEMEMVCS